MEIGNMEIGNMEIGNMEIGILSMVSDNKFSELGFQRLECRLYFQLL